MKKTLVTLIFSLALVAILRAPAITVTSFGPNGEGGTKNGQTITIGSGGTVFELDGFLRLGTTDLNGSQFGVSAQLSRDTLPLGLDFQFTNYLASDQTTLILSYTFTNTTLTTFSNVDFFVLLDAEIDQTANTFYNEYGSVAGDFFAHGYDASQWQIDEPDFQTGTVLKNLFMGSLDDSNSIPAGASNDVAMSLGFALGDVHPGRDATVLIQIAEDSQQLGSYSLVQHDNDSASKTVITLSGVLPATGSEMTNPPHEMLVLQGRAVRDGATNGAASPTDTGLAGVTVSLMSNSIPVMTNVTDFAGQYQFSVPPGLNPGNYTVTADAGGPTFVPVPATTKSYFASSNPSAVTLPRPVPVLNFDFRGKAVQQFANIDARVRLHLSGWNIHYATGGLRGSVSVTNPPDSGAAFSPPWKLGLKASSDFYFPNPDGVLPDGVTNVDLSVAVNAQMPNGVLNPGQGFVLTNAVEIFSLYRSAPTNSLFEIWATQQ